MGAAMSTPLWWWARPGMGWMRGPKGEVMELVVDHWRDIGIRVNLKQTGQGLREERTAAGVMEMTVWHGDRTTDILFPPEPFYFVPTRMQWEVCMWNDWAQWNLTGGKMGTEPPPVIKDLINWWNEMCTSMDEQRRIELGKKILRSQAENLWTINICTPPPQIVVVRFQGPKANGMPEMHSLTPVLANLQAKGLNVALVTDGRMSGASGKVLSAIHVCPEAVDGGPIARLADPEYLESYSLYNSSLQAIRDFLQDRQDITLPYCGEYLQSHQSLQELFRHTRFRLPFFTPLVVPSLRNPND